MTISELIKQLQQYNPNLTVSISCMNHSYDSINDKQSHGKMFVCLWPNNRIRIGHTERDMQYSIKLLKSEIE